MNLSDSNIGIIDLEIYYPLLCVDQKELEVYDGCQGKYVAGLGQNVMAICPLVEDPVSIALTVVHRLMERTGLDYSKIGRVDVGTESSIDHSKSIKSHLMELFEKSSNFSVEGADNINACYGGTAALFNCLNWVACQPDNEKLALVVTSDISTYSNESKGARATSGAASVCMLIGRNAILPFETTKGHYMCNSYDFYKPICLLYPEFDGKLSTKMYIKCLLNSSTEFTKNKIKEEKGFELFDDSNFFAFHSPYTKLVKKSYLYMRNFHKDLLLDEKFQDTICNVEHLLDESELHEERLNLEKKLFNEYSTEIQQNLEPSLNFATQIGNSYCSSVFMCLASILASKEYYELLGKRILLFSYGSGCLSSMYSLRIPKNSSPGLEKICSYMKRKLGDLKDRFVRPPTYLVEIIIKRFDREAINLAIKHAELDEIISSNTYYLKSIDNKNRRFYNLYTKA